MDFPYLDLDNSVEIAQKVRVVGGDECEWNQLATKLSVAGDGGGFRMRLLSAKTYGLLTYERGTIYLTDLGIAASDPQREKRARYDAFMYVALYKQLFDRLNGQPLPPPAALERMIEQLGVAPKQKDKARQVFMRSAKQAGLFELASDRLSTPPSGTTRTQGSSTSESSRSGQSGFPASSGYSGYSGGSGGADGPSQGLHPFIEGLLRTLPAPDSNWPAPARQKWLQAAGNIFDLIYRDDELPKASVEKGEG